MKQTELKEQLKQAETNTATTQLLHKALQEKKAIEQLQLQKEGAQKAFEERVCAHAAFEHNQLHLASQQQAMMDRLHVWLQHSNEVSSEGQQQNGSFHDFIPALQAQLEQMKLRWKMQERHALAAILAGELADGDHCPVCGATEHPSKLIPSSGTANRDEIELQLQQGEVLLQQVKERIYTHQQRLHKMGAVMQQAVELVSLQSRSILAEPEVGQSLREAAAGLDGAVSQRVAESYEGSGFSDLQRKWMDMEIEWNSVISRADELEQSFQVLLKEHNAHAQQAVQTAAQQQAAASLLAEAETRLAAVQSTMNEQLKLWQERYTELSWEEIDNQLEHLLAKERLAEELRGRIEKSIPFWMS